jgi:arylsulfatase A-like enzyme
MADTQKKPNTLFIMADDIGWFNAGYRNHGIMPKHPILTASR